MDETADWVATQQLRAWERQQLGLRAGQRLLDVGCGLGDAALALAHDLAPDGEVVGVDASAAMIDGACARAHDASCPVHFSVGNAVALDEPDDSFDVVRCERTLQWLAEPAAAASELARVVRPGGLVSLIDTDWSTFELDVGDVDLARRVRAAMQVERRRPADIGGRLAAVAQDAGLRPIAHTAATQTWDAWDPDESPAPAGCFSMSSLADDLIDTGHLDPDDRQRFIATIHTAARDGRFHMTLTMAALVAAAPSPGPTPPR